MRTAEEIFRGSIVAIVTPMREGEVDYETAAELADWQVEEGTNGIVVCGTTGESPTLSEAEKAKLLTTVLEAVKGRVPVIMGTGSNDTAHAVRASKEAQELGADALLVVTPYYNKPEQKGLLAHYLKIADAVGIPICLYSVPGRTSVAIAPDTVCELSRHPNIAALKEAGGSVDRVSQVRQVCDILVVSGDDAITLPMMSVGARGAISVTANVVPAENAEMTRAALEGDWEKARGVHEKLYPLARGLFVETNPVPVKAALAMMGKIRGELRLPLTPMGTANRERLAETLRSLGLPVQFGTV
jgi:4-hydroxy-tetrahydrodipicolinate synthase